MHVLLVLDHTLNDKTKLNHICSGRTIPLDGLCLISEETLASRFPPASSSKLIVNPVHCKLCITTVSEDVSNSRCKRDGFQFFL